MDTRLDQPDSVTTFDARGQDQTAFLSLVYDLSNEENCPSWTTSNNLLGESLFSVTEVSFSWSACRNFSHLRNQPPPLPSLSWKSCRLSPTISKLQQLYHQLPKWREKLLRTLPISTFAWRSIFSESNQGAAIEILLNSSRNFHISRSCGASNYHARSSIFHILM